MIILHTKDNSRALVLNDGQAFSLLNGKWHKKIMFDSYELDEDFYLVKTYEEAKPIIGELLKDVYDSN